MLTLFHLDDEHGLRGGERQALYLAAAMKARGHRNVAVCRKGGAFAREAQRLGLEVWNLPFLFEFDPSTALPLGLRARREGPAILHSHTAHAAAAASLASLLGGVPFIAHRRVDFPVRRFGRIFKYARAAKVICISEAVRRLMAEAGLDESRTALVHSAIPVTDEEASWAGLPPGHFAPAAPARREALRRELGARHGLDAAKVWIGNLAALVPHKDHAALIECAAEVVKRRPEALFLVAGKGSEKAALAARIEALGLAGSFRLLGHVEAPTELLKALDLFVLSSWGEGLGSVLIEAAACGLPIAATEAGGVSDFIAAGRTGLLCPPRDPKALAANVLRLLEEPGLAARLKTAAFERLPEFGLTRMAERMEKIYAAV